MANTVLSNQEIIDYYSYILHKLKKRNVYAWQVANIQWLGGMRFAEVGGEGWSFNENGLLLAPRKGNDGRIFPLGQLPSYFERAILKGQTWNSPISYNTYTSEIEFVRPFPVYVGKKELLSHGFRYSYSRALLEQIKIPNLVRQNVGERTMASMAIYLYGEVYR